MTLPERFAKQTLSGYVRQHLELVNSVLDRGVSYAALGDLIAQAGFGKIAPNALASAVFRARHDTRQLRGARAALPSPGMTRATGGGS